MTKILECAADVQTQVGQLPIARDMKVINFLDEHAQCWISHTPLAFIAFGNAKGIRISAAGGDAGFMKVRDSHCVELPLARLDKSTLPEPGMTFGSLLIVPQLNETLRINGRIKELENETLALAVEECYLHCGKALLRANFWDQRTIEPSDTDPVSIITQSSLMLLATMSSEGKVDLSPKGDPASSLLRAENEYVWFPDRPGNRRIDSFRNIVEQPNVSVLAMVPGNNHYVEVVGEAEICIDEKVANLFSVKEKQPKLVTRVKARPLEVEKSLALQNFQAYVNNPTPEEIKPIDIFKAHIKHSSERGLSAGLVRAAVSIPGLLKRELASDYEKNRY